MTFAYGFLFYVVGGGSAEVLILDGWPSSVGRGGGEGGDWRRKSPSTSVSCLFLAATSFLVELGRRIMGHYLLSCGDPPLSSTEMEMDSCVPS